MRVLLILVVMMLGTVSVAEAAPETSHAVTKAVDTLVKHLMKDLRGQKTPLGRTAVLASVSNDFNPDVKEYLYRRLEAKLPETKQGEIVSCFQCEAVRAHSDGNQIVIEKGLPSNEAASVIAKELSLETFLDANLDHTGNRIVMQVQLIGAGTDKIIWQKSYQAHARLLVDKNFFIEFGLGPAYIASADTGEDKVGMGFAAALGERFFGFGKLGAAFSSTFSINNITFNQSTGPYVSFNLNEMFGWYWPFGNLSFFINPGYAVSQKAIGLLMRSGLTLRMGSFSYVNAELQTPVYSQDADKRYPTSAVVMVGFDIF